MFVGASDGKHEEIKEKLTKCGVPAKSLRVRGFVQSRDDLKRWFHEVDLVLNYAFKNGGIWADRT